MNSAVRPDQIQVEAVYTDSDRQLKLLEFALSRMNEALYLTADDGSFCMVNDEACRSLGYSRDELLMMGVSDIQLDFSEPFWTDHTNQLVGNGFHVFESMLKTKNGQVFPVEVNVSMLEYFDGQRYRLALVRDISARKRAEEALAKSRLFHDKILNTVTDPLVVKDSNHRYVLVNDAFCNFMHRTRSDLLGSSDFDLFPAHEAEVFLLVDKIVLACGTEHVSEEALTDPAGNVHIFIAKKTRYVDENGEKFIVCILRDVTKQKLAEKRLNDKRKSLTAMAIELSLAEERERIRIASQLHDQIGQTLILARIKLAMMEHIHSPEEHKLTGSVVSDLMDKVIQDVRSMTVQISPPLLVAAGLESALECLAKQIQSDYCLKVVFTNDCEEKPLHEELRFVIYQIARELLINVVKHANTDSAGLSVSRDGGQLVLAVIDHGKGFNTDENVMNAAVNCSFGLFNIQQRVDHLGGEMTLCSAPGKGTEVEVRMPLDLDSI